VEYAYADGSLNTARAVSVTYPDGSVVSYDYGAANGDDDRLSRVQKIADDGVNLVEYSYYGQANVLKTKYPTPDVTLNFGYPSGVPYDGCLDRFGRVKQNPWVKGSGPIAGATYQYDRASNRTQMQPQGFTSTNAVERYSYDGLQRLTRSVRGSTTTLKSQEAWGLDATGNWGKYDVLDVDVPAQNLAQQRTSNPANEITDVTETYGPVWPTPTYDRAGNTKTFPQSLTPTSGYAAKYDAWNRLVEVKQGSTVVATYQYDGLNRRVTQVSGGTTRHFYYSKQWQVLEERTGTNPDSAPAERQFFWGLRYIDDLICRWQPATSTRLYNCQDANWNTVAILDSAGTVLQRYRYSAYGTPTRLNPDGSVASGSDTLLWETLYAGYRYDRTTGLYQVRYRWLNPAMGAWVTRDPMGYVEGLSLKAYVRSSPSNVTDAYGLAGCCGPQIYNWLTREAKQVADYVNAIKASTRTPPMFLMEGPLIGHQIAQTAILFKGFQEFASRKLAYKTQDFTNVLCRNESCPHTVTLNTACIGTNQIGNMLFGYAATLLGLTDKARAYGRGEYKDAFGAPEPNWTETTLEGGFQGYREEAFNVGVRVAQGGSWLSVRRPHDSEHEGMDCTPCKHAYDGPNSNFEDPPSPYLDERGNWIPDAPRPRGYPLLIPGVHVHDRFGPNMY